MAAIGVLWSRLVYYYSSFLLSLSLDTVSIALGFGYILVISFLTIYFTYINYVHQQTRGQPDSTGQRSIVT